MLKTRLSSLSSQATIAQAPSVLRVLDPSQLRHVVGGVGQATSGPVGGWLTAGPVGGWMTGPVGGWLTGPVGGW